MVAGMAVAQGTVKGKITDAESGEELVGATVRIENTSHGAITDMDGNYTIPNVPKGVYKIVVSYISYQTQNFPNAVIDNGQTVVLNVKLKSDDALLEGIEVVGKANRESQTALLLEQKRALIATQAIGAMELSTKGISNAEAAVAQISGVSKQEGQKNVFIRGLADRYNQTYLNGFPIPSDDPEYKNISLDIFDTDMIQSISVAKAFNARQGGDVAGAVIDISSKELVGDKLFEVSASVGANTSVLGNKFYRQTGANYFGFADNTRPAVDLFEAGSLKQGQAYPFKNALMPRVIGTPIDHSLGLSLGKRFQVANNPLTLLLIANHSIGYSHSNRISRSLSTQDVSGIYESDLKGDNSAVSTRQLVLGSAALDLNKKHHLSYNFLLIHSNGEYVAKLAGLHQTKNTSDEVGYGIDVTRQQMNENMLIVNQLDSKWTLSKDLIFNVGAAVNIIKSAEPDRRVNYFLKDGRSENEFKWNPNSSDDTRRFYSDLKEQDYNVKTSLEWTLNDKAFLTAGYAGRFIHHNFDAFSYITHAMRFLFTPEELKNGINLDEIYNAETVDQKYIDSTKPYTDVVSGQSEWYTAKKNVHSGYVEFAYKITPKFSAQASLRSDFIYQIVTTGMNDSQKSVSPEEGTSPWMKPFILPSLNLKYDINDKNALRLGVSRSYTLPRFKEVSDYEYVNIDYTSTGNPKVRPSDVWNLDLKYDWYITAGELLSANVFYKHIKDPLARVFAAGSASKLVYDNPSDKAQLAGIEVELRKDIFNLYNMGTEVRHKLSTNISASYLYSTMIFKVEGAAKNGRESRLEGASPFLANADLTYAYSNAKNSYSAGLLMSYFSDRIHTLGTIGGQHNDLMEQGLVKLNFVASAEFGQHFNAKFKVNNILDTPHRLLLVPNEDIRSPQSPLPADFDYKAPQTMSEYRKGVSFSLSVGYKF